MSNINKQARVILRKGKNTDFSADKVETAELVFASDLGILYIKKDDGTILAVGPYIESSEFKVSETAEITDKNNNYPSISYLENNYDNKEGVKKAIKDASDKLEKKITANKEEAESNLFFNDFTFDTTTGELEFLSDGQNTGKKITLNLTSGGLSFDTGYVDENGYIHLTKDGEEIDDFTPFFVGNGGSGGSSGSKLTFSLTSALGFSVADTSGEANISFNFKSIDTETSSETGDGTLQIYVNDTLKRSINVSQGENTINIFEYLSAGSNLVKLTLTDSYGLAASRKCTISVESISLAWNLSSTLKNSGNLSITLTPTGTGEKTLYVIVDGEVYNSSKITASGIRVTKTVSSLTHGEHIIKAYCSSDVNGSTISSKTLVAAVAQIEDGATDVVVASDFIANEVEQFTNITINHRVIDPQNNPANIEYLVNGTLYNSASVDQSEQVWTYKPTTAGTLVFEITCGGKSVWNRTVAVKSLNTPVDEITESLAYKFDPSAMTDLNSISLSENFDTVNGGLQNDESGNKAFVVMKGDRATIPYKLFADDTRKIGKEIKLIYKVDNCSKFDAEAINCVDGGIGLTVKANEINCNSELTSIGIQTCEGEKSEIDINIETDSQNRLIRIYENGSHTQIKRYSDSDNFTQGNPQNITIGSDDCNVWIYLIRVYTSPLQNKEILTNYIFDGADGTKITDRYNKSLIYDESTGNVSPTKVAEICPEAHIITFHGPKISTAKTDKVKGYVTHVMTSGGTAHTWKSSEVIDKAQGTSSAAYVLAGLNHDFEFVSGFEYEDGTTSEKYAMSENSIPVKYLNFKANIASSENINNIVNAEWYNKFQPFIRDARKSDSRVRDTVEGQMGVLFYHNTGSEPVKAGALTVQPDETVLYAVGCLNNSKKNNEVFAQNDTDDVACIEFLNNTSAQCRFKSADLTNEQFDGSGSFDFRYLSDAVDKAEMISKFSEMLSFVVSCDPEQASDEALSSSVTYDGVIYSKDTVDYRKAKFKAEASNYFVLNSLFFHQLYTLFFCLPDNRAKNTFWGYSKSQGKWHVNFAYDMDTSMGNDNEGGLTLRYGYLDSDTIGTKNVYNAADSTIWKLNWDVFADELRALYIDRENAGCWNAEAFGKMCNDLQNKICTALWMEDAIKKYEYPFTLEGDSSYFEMCNGRKTLQRSQFLKFQPQFISSYMRSSFCKNSQGIIRGYTPTNYAGVTPENKMTITPYCDTFIYVDVAQQSHQVRGYAGVPVTLTFTDIGSMNDTEISIYNADFIQDLGEIACLYPGVCNLSQFKRLKYAKIGSSISDYENTNLTNVSLNNCASLEYLNVEGCSKLEQALDLAPNVMLKELYTRRSGVTGVTFAKGGRIRTAVLNSISSLTAKSLDYLTNLSVTTFNSLKTLIVEDCPSIDALNLVQSAVNLNRLRITDIDWTLDNSRILINLSRLSGVDDDGYNTDVAVLTGRCTISKISQYRYNLLRNAFAKLELVTDTENFISSYTVEFKDYDGTLLDTQIIEDGEEAENPVLRAYNPISVPKRGSTVETVYSFGGWDKDLKNITSDTTVNAVYTESVRTYTVRFYKDSTLLETITADAHSSAYYNGDTLNKSGYIWTGWDKSTSDVTADIDTYAVFEEPKLPDYVKDLSQFTYLYSEDISDADESAYTMGQIYAICEAGKASEYFSVASEIKLLPGADSTIKDSSIVFQVFGYNHYKLADSDNFANVVFGMKGLLNANRQMNSGNTNVGGFEASAMNKWLNGTMIYNLSKPWQNLIKTVQVLASKGGTEETILTSKCKLFLFSDAEVGFNKTAVPYKNEVDRDAESVQFPIFTDNNSRIKKTYNGTGSANSWWLRSASASYSSSFENVYYNGGSFSNGANYSNGVCFGFCI